MKKEEIVVDHDNFVIGIMNRTIRLEVLQPNKESRGIGFFEKGSASSIINNIVTFLTWCPLVAIPIICYKQNNWLLLLGFLGIFFGLTIAGIGLKTIHPKREFFKSILPLALFPAILIYYLGPFHTLTFIAICFYYAYFLSSLNNLIYDELVKQKLLKDPSSYYEAQTAGRIKTYLIV